MIYVEFYAHSAESESPRLGLSKSIFNTKERNLFFRTSLDSQKNHKDYREFPSTLHPASSRINTVYLYGTFFKTNKQTPIHYY